MRALILSDLHFDHLPDQTICTEGRIYNNDFNLNISFDLDKFDVVFIAGDCCDGCVISEHKFSKSLYTEKISVFKLIRNIFKDKKVYYVLGNHDYWGVSDTSYIHSEAQNNNIIILDNDISFIGDKRILGTTLWSDYDLNKSFSDFSEIPILRKRRSNIRKLHTSCISFLNTNLVEGDIVITHHSPSYKNIDSIYNTSERNMFFHINLDELIESRKPYIWICGHIHNSVDHILGETRVISNPLGYYKLFGLFENRSFNNELIIEF